MVFHRKALACLAFAVIAAGCNSVDPSSLAESGTPVSTSRIPTPSGQYVVQGEILRKYADAGGPSGPLGTPISNELPAPNGGQYSKFQTGVIYWSPRSGAHVLSGVIRAAWESNGGPDGPLGYPVSDQRPIPGGSVADFEHGTITDTNGQPQIVTR